MTKDELRDFEELIQREWQAGKIRVPVHLNGGNEEALLAIFERIKDDDWVVSTHRNHYHYLLKKGDKDALYKEILSEPTGICGGRSGSMHTVDTSIGFLASCLVGCGAPVAVGLAIGVKLRGGTEHVWCFLGDGAVDQGQFFESLVYAETMELPVTFVVEDNDRSVCSSKQARGVHRSVTRKAAMKSPKCLYYAFTATKPHVGSGVHVNF